jgi:superfamily I DNA/RNA helicase
VRQFVKHSLSGGDKIEIQEVVEALECVADDDDDFESHLVNKLKLLEAKLDEKNVGDKLLFSTIHRFKGRERPCILLIDLKKPFAKVNTARKAVLAPHHEEGCLNRSGTLVCQCPGFLSRLSDMENAQIAEKQRLHYVGASRGKRALFLHVADPEFAASQPKFAQLCANSNEKRGEWASTSSSVV